MLRRFPISGATCITAAAIASLTANADAALTIDLRFADGGKSFVLRPNEPILVDIWATVSGSSTDLANSYGLSSVNGSILSQGPTRVNIAGKKGDVAQYKGGQRTTALAPFAKSGEQPGNEVDLDGDGDIDLGAPNQNDATGFFIARADPQEYFGSPTNTGVAIPGGQGVEWKVGRIELTIGEFGNDNTHVFFTPRRNAAGQVPAEAALWYDDQGGLSAKNGATGMLVSGQPLCICIPDPSSISLVACAGLGLLRRRGRATRA